MPPTNVSTVKRLRAHRIMVEPLAQLRTLTLDTVSVSAFRLLPANEEHVRLDASFTHARRAVTVPPESSGCPPTSR